MNPREYNYIHFYFLNIQTFVIARFQGQLHKYTNAFKGFQSRYCVLDAPNKSLLYFMVID